MKTEVVNVSPKMAIDLLKLNTHNRVLRQDKVLEFASYITNGQWKLTHQGIAISITNTLLDGQHRLHAILKSGKSVPIMIVRGLPDDVMTVIDTGKKRTTSDAFKLLEVPYYSLAPAAIIIYENIKLNRQTLNTDDKNKGLSLTSTDEKYQFYLENTILFEKLAFVANKCYKVIKLYPASAIIGISLYLILERKHSFDKVSEFWLQVFNISDQPQSKSTKCLHNTLLKYISGSEKLKNTYKMGITIKAWNHHLNGTDVKLLKFSEQETMPKFQ